MQVSQGSNAKTPQITFSDPFVPALLGRALLRVCFQKKPVQSAERAATGIARVSD